MNTQFEFGLFLNSISGKCAIFEKFNFLNNLLYKDYDIDTK
jgi:hypothetical protein